MIQNKLFTVGHSTHEIQSFIELLEKYSIKTLCDVRSQPYSKYSSQFNKEFIEFHLKKIGISYLFFGRELGGRSEDPTCYIDGKLQYGFLSNSPLFQEGLDKLMVLIKTGNIALMCSEADPLICHRTILICRELCQTKGVSEDDIYHILPDATFQTHKQMEQHLLERLKISPDMLRSEEECIEEAYNRQAHKIAYIRKDMKRTAISGKR